MDCKAITLKTLVAVLLLLLAVYSLQAFYSGLRYIKHKIRSSQDNFICSSTTSEAELSRGILHVKQVYTTLFKPIIERSS